MGKIKLGTSLKITKNTSNNSPLQGNNSFMSSIHGGQISPNVLEILYKPMS